jgi:hypothetical protein
VKGRFQTPASAKAASLSRAKNRIGGFRCVGADEAIRQLSLRVRAGVKLAGNTLFLKGSLGTLFVVFRTLGSPAGLKRTSPKMFVKFFSFSH